MFCFTQQLFWNFCLKASQSGSEMTATATGRRTQVKAENMGGGTFGNPQSPGAFLLKVFRAKMAVGVLNSASFLSEGSSAAFRPLQLPDASQVPLLATEHYSCLKQESRLKRFLHEGSKVHVLSQKSPSVSGPNSPSRMAGINAHTRLLHPKVRSRRAQ